MNQKQQSMGNSPAFTDLTIGKTGHVITENTGARNRGDETFGKMTSVKVNRGDEIVRYRDKGDRYYIIRKGEAEVWKPDPETDVWHCAASLGPGDSFGEEAILVGGFRNATVRMVTPGVLLALEAEDFNGILRNRLVEEVTPEQARVMAIRSDTEFLDCRFDVEYSEERIPKARHLPLHNLRQSTHKLDHGRRYLVYCRCGQRSVCATYLLRERGFNAVSVMGGIRDWPYALERGA
jgi:rhodanese-related sulfurtransferase